MVIHIYSKHPEGDVLICTSLTPVLAEDSYGFTVGVEIYNHASFRYEAEPLSNYEDRMLQEQLRISVEEVAKAEREIETLNLLIDLGVIV